jgi:hypothetical protein
MKSKNEIAAVFYKITQFGYPKILFNTIRLFKVRLTQLFIRVLNIYSNTIGQIKYKLANRTYMSFPVYMIVRLGHARHVSNI